MLAVTTLLISRANLDITTAFWTLSLGTWTLSWLGAWIDQAFSAAYRLAGVFAGMWIISGAALGFFGGYWRVEGIMSAVGLGCFIVVFCAYRGKIIRNAWQAKNRPYGFERRRAWQ